MSTPLLLSAALMGGTPVAVDTTLLAGLPLTSASFTAHGTTHRCEGPRLRDVVSKLGAPTGAALRGAALAQGVLVRARDGYGVLFSLGELDSTLGASGAILALRCDGKMLDAEDGPIRVVAPGAQRAARSVRQVATITLVDAATASDR